MQEERELHVQQELQEQVKLNPNRVSVLSMVMKLRRGLSTPATRRKRRCDKARARTVEAITLLQEYEPEGRLQPTEVWVPGGRISQFSCLSSRN